MNGFVKTLLCIVMILVFSFFCGRIWFNIGKYGDKRFG